MNWFLNLLDRNVIEREIKREKVQMKPLYVYLFHGPSMQQGACSMEYISGTFLRVKGDQKAQVLYYAGIWIQFRIMTLSWSFNPRLLRESIYFWLPNWVGVVNPAFWLIKIGLIFCTLIMQKKTFEIKIFFYSNCVLLIIQYNFVIVQSLKSCKFKVKLLQDQILNGIYWLTT